MPRSLPCLTEDDISALGSPQSFERGADYYHSGAVFNTRIVNNELRGDCRGSNYSHYRVSALLGSSGILAFDCTCPYDWDGACKHIVALLLAWVHTPGIFQFAAPVDERLAGKSKEELIALIREMLKREPNLERLLDLPLRPDSESPLDLDPFRRQIGFFFMDDFPDPQELVIELAAIAETADRFAGKENCTAAGALYHLILSAIIPSYDQLYDEDGDISSVLQQCATGLEGSLTGGTPDDATRKAWLAVLLEAVFKDVEMGGIELAYPAEDILVKHATDKEWREVEMRVREKLRAMTGKYSTWDRELLVNLLARRLEGTGREPELTDLIFELGSPKQQAYELLDLGRFEGAIAIAEEYFVDFPGQVLHFADTLVEAGGSAEAIVYVTGQLESRSRSSYLTWLAQLAEQQQDPETAMKWWLNLFGEAPNLENYRNLRVSAQRLEQWDSLRPGLVQKLEADQYWELVIEIALEERDVPRALECLPRERWGRQDLRVARAAERDYPYAAIEIYNRLSDQLIADRGRGNYQEAATMLQRVKELYLQQGTPTEWDHFLTELRQRHARLPALMDELDKADL